MKLSLKLKPEFDYKFIWTNRQTYAQQMILRRLVVLRAVFLGVVNLASIITNYTLFKCNNGEYNCSIQKTMIFKNLKSGEIDLQTAGGLGVNLKNWSPWVSLFFLIFKIIFLI